MGILNLILREPEGRRAQGLPSQLDIVELKWYKTLVELQCWLTEHGAEPLERSTDTDERRLGTWLRNQRSRQSSKRWSSEREAALEKAYPGWLVRNNVRWAKFRSSLDEKYLSIAMAVEMGMGIDNADQAAFAEMACTAAIFYEKNSRQALRTGVDDDEARLALWLNRVRTRLKSQKLPAERLATLNAVAPGWDETVNSSYWIRRQVNDEIGRKGEADAADAYKQSWSSLSPAQKTVVAELLPDAVPMSAEERTLARAEEIIQWRRETGRFPVNGKSAKSRHEATLAASLWKFRRDARKGSLAPDIAEVFHSAYPLWLTVRKTEDWFQLQAERLAAFYTEHGRWPSVMSTDGDEKQLGIWLQNQRQAKKGKGNYTWSSDRETSLDEVCPGWFEVRTGRGSGRGTWNDTLDELAVWLKQRGEKPRSTSSDVDEKRLAAWLYNQRSHRKRGEQSWSSNREAALDAVYPGWAD